MMRGNLHTHTTYCDGKNTPKELVEEAIKKSFGYIGFSGHSHTFFDASYAMTEENTKKYIDDIKTLKALYKNEISVLCGIEKDAFSDYPTAEFDYVIASTHYVRAGDRYFDVDMSEKLMKSTIEEYFGQDPYAYAEAYFSTVGEMTGDIIGHFDLITKFDRDENIFSPQEVRYKKAALSALDVLEAKKSVLEVNTGAMARGYKDFPYPSDWLLDEIKKRDMRVILTSDCHDKVNLDYGFENAEKILARKGFSDFYNIDFIKNRL